MASCVMYSRRSKLKRCLPVFSRSRAIKLSVCVVTFIGCLLCLFKSNLKSKFSFVEHHSPQKGLRWYVDDFPSFNSTSVLESSAQKMAPHDRELVSPHNHSYIHNLPDVCSTRKVELVIGVPARTYSFAARQAIRETWGQFANNSQNMTVLLFFLGSTIIKSVQHAIDKEALRYGDIIQENFLDSYGNLSIKSVSIMKWVSLYCSISTFVLKADEDTYINVPRLLSRLQFQYVRGPVFIIGELRGHVPPQRNNASRYYMKVEDYPWRLYPNFIAGPAYAMTTSAAKRLYKESRYVKRLVLEDVWLTGLVADKAAIPRIHDDEFTIHFPGPGGCHFKNNIGGGHGYKPRELKDIHKQVLNQTFYCHRL